MHIDIAKLSQQTAQFLSSQTQTHDHIRKEIDELRHVLKQHNYLYYVTANPIISDAEYDQLFRLLQDREAHLPELITPQSPTQQLSGQLLEGFAQESHLGIMQSLQNTYNAEEVQHRHGGLVRLLAKEGKENRSYIVEPKFDGMSVEIVYEQGAFSRAVTRGNGRIGEDITQHARMIHGLPMQITELKNIAVIAFRWEIVMPKTAFERLGKQEMTSGGLEFANPRNATAGTLRHLNPQLVRKRGLAIEVYDLIYSSTDFAITTALEQRELRASRWLPLHPWTHTFSDIRELISFCASEQTVAEAQQQAIGLDGLVVKINELEVRELLGSTSHHPRWAIAYKFPAEQLTTQLENVTFQVGRTGVLTPVAHLTPVRIWGVTVQRATLHNRDFIQGRGLRLHDRVVVQRSGEVIPYIVSVVTERRSGHEKPITQPKNCPVCAHEVYFDEEGGSLRCGNVSCSAQIKQRLQHYASKGCLDIAGLGPRLVDICVDAGLLSTIPDMYTLPAAEKKQLLLTLPGIGAKKVASLEKEIKKAVHKPLRRVFFWLSIRHIGGVIAQEIVKAYEQQYPAKKRGVQTFTDFCQESEKILQIYGIWPEIAASLRHFFEDAANRDVLQKLDDVWVIDWGFSLSPIQTTPLTGKHIVITGTFDISRNDLTNLLQQQGAKVTSSVSSATDMVLVGDDPWSKLEMAQELGIKLFPLDKFLDIYGLDTSGIQPESSSSSGHRSQEGLFG